VRRNNKQTGRLDVGGVEHDADCGTEGLGREVVAELSTDNAGVTWKVLSVCEFFPYLSLPAASAGAIETTEINVP
jgi:hypothetical protein